MSTPQEENVLNKPRLKSDVKKVMEKTDLAEKKLLSLMNISNSNINVIAPDKNTAGTSKKIIMSENIVLSKSHAISMEKFKKPERAGETSSNGSENPKVLPEISNISQGYTEEIMKLKRQLIDFEAENRRLRAQNYELVNEVINGFQRIEEKIKNLDNLSNASLRSQIDKGDLFPPGFEDLINMKVHVGLRVWVEKMEYDRMRFRVGSNPKRYISNLTRLLFTDEVLKTCSVTGKSSNAHKETSPKQALDPVKLNAVRALSEHWMKTKLKLEEDIVNHLKNSTDYISRMAAELNRIRDPFKRKKCIKKGNKPKKCKSTEIVEEDDIEDDTDEINENNEKQGTDDQCEQKNNIGESNDKGMDEDKEKEYEDQDNEKHMDECEEKNAVSDVSNDDVSKNVSKDDVSDVNSDETRRVDDEEDFDDWMSQN